MLKSFFNSRTLIIAVTFLTVSMANAQVFTDGDIIHMKDANGTLTADNLVEIGNTSSLTTLDLFFRVTIDNTMPTGTLINVVTWVPTNQTAPTPTFHYKAGSQWSALQTSTSNGIVSIAYSVLQGIATAQSATTVEVRVRYTTVPTYRFQLELGRGTTATTSLDRIYFDCQTGAISRAVYDVTNDGLINNADITAVSQAITNKSLTGDVSEDGRINYVDFDLVTFVVAQTASIASTNRRPTTTDTIPDQELWNSFTGEVYAHNHFSDPDGDTLTYTASTTDSTIASVAVGGVGNSTVYIYANALGTVTITVTVTDPSGSTASQTFSITVVQQPNRAPETYGSIPGQEVKVGGTAAKVDVSGYFSDPDTDTLTYTASSSDTGKATVSVSGSTVSITPVAVGTATITVTATDPDGLSADQTFTATVVGNRAPTAVGTIPDQTLTLGGSGTVNLANYFSDPDGDTLIYTASSSNTNIVGVSMSSTTATITGMSPGTATITFTATDPDGLSATRGITPTVSQYSSGFADALPSITSEERAQIADSLAMDRVIFNELRNASTDAHDWVELRNVSTADANLDDWQLLIVTSETVLGVSFAAGAVLPAGELLLLTNTDPNAPDMPLADTGQMSIHYVVDEDLILPQANFTLLLRSSTGWEDSVGNYFFGYGIPSTAPPLTADSAWYRVRPDALGYRSEAWMESGYQGGIGYDIDVPEPIALGSPGYSQASLRGDVNGDGMVNILDLVLVASKLGESGATAVDVNSDGIINVQDLVLVSNAFGGVLDAPSAN